jgi:ATP-dependent DNA ligase
MPFVKPMLCHKLPEGFTVSRVDEWVADEKFDGHRLIVTIGDGSTDLLASEKYVQAVEPRWTPEDPADAHS